MPKGESIDALLAPRLRVSRPVAACSRCRTAKIKCDGKLPACTACERTGRAETCSGANDEYAKGKERSYVAALESAFERSQKRLAEAKILQATEPSGGDALAASYMLGPSQALSPQRIASGGRVHRKEASDVDNLVGDFGFLSVNATSRDFHGFTATMSFARLLLAISQLGELPLVDTRTLPARYSITPLLEHYLDNTFALMPFFSETDFMASVSAVYADAGRFAKPADHWMVRMVLAIVAADSSQEKEDADYRLAQQHVGAALAHAEDVLHPGSIAGVQAILLLVQYALLDPSLFSCWHLIGFASRVMVDLGLHTEPAPGFRIKREEREMRRRVFYCVYSLDRSISMALSRTFSFTDDSAFVSLPAVAQSSTPSYAAQEQGPQLFLRSLQPSLYLFDIRRVQSSLYQETRSSSPFAWPRSTASTYIRSILKDIRSWFSTIPSTLPQSHIVFFRLESLYSQILALSPSDRIPDITEFSRVLIFEYAIQYADQLHRVTRHKDWHASFAVTDAHRMDFIGRQFLDAMWISFDNLLSGSVPRESPILSPQTYGSPTSIPSPSSPHISRPTSSLENTVRALRCLNRTIQILAFAHKRFGNPCTTLQTRFEQESAVLKDKVKMKQLELGTVQYITGGPPPQPPMRPDFGQPFFQPVAGQGMQMLHPLENTQHSMFLQQQQQQQQQQQREQQKQPRPPPPPLLQHVTYPGTSVEQQRYQQDLMVDTDVDHQRQPPRLVRYVSDGNQDVAVYGGLYPQPQCAGARLGGGVVETGSGSLPESSHTRQGYEFQGARRPERRGSGG